MLPRPHPLTFASLQPDLAGVTQVCILIPLGNFFCSIWITESESSWISFLSSEKGCHMEARRDGALGASAVPGK